jgi:hypothetical protein
VDAFHVNGCFQFFLYHLLVLSSKGVVKSLRICLSVLSKISIDYYHRKTILPMKQTAVMSYCYWPLCLKLSTIWVIIVQATLFYTPYTWRQHLLLTHSLHSSFIFLFQYPQGMIYSSLQSDTLKPLFYLRARRICSLKRLSACEARVIELALTTLI